MTGEDVLEAPQAAEYPVKSDNPPSNAGGNASLTTQIKPLTAPSGANGSVATRIFQGSGLRRPSKIPRLHKQQSGVSVASTSADQMPADSSATSKLSASSAASVASSSRETTPFSSPSKPKRLREPTKIVGRKRTRDEMLQAVADRLAVGRQRRQETVRQIHSEELSSQTTLDDAASVASYRYDEDEDASDFGSQTLVAAEDEDQKREQELVVARALQQDLLRDRARLRLKINSLKDDVEVYYELLVRMEQVTMAAKSASVTVEDEGKREQLARLADRIQAIVSARAVSVADEESTKSTAQNETAQDLDDEVEEY